MDTVQKMHQTAGALHMKFLRSIMGIKWQDRMTNIEVLDRSGLSSIEAMVLRAQLHWTGQVIQMNNSHISCQLLYGVLM